MRRGIRRDDRGNLDVEEDADDDANHADRERKERMDAQKAALKNKRNNKNRFAGMIARNDNKKATSITTISVAGGKSTNIGKAAPTKSSFGFAPKGGAGGFAPPPSQKTGYSNTNGYEDTEDHYGTGPPPTYQSNSDVYDNDNARDHNREHKENRRGGSATEKNLDRKGIAPSFDPTPSQGQTMKQRRRASVTLDFSDMGAFLTQPVPPGLKLQCTIYRNRKGLKGKVFPSYECYYGEYEDKKLLCCASKRSKNKTSNYIISMNHGQSKNVPSYLGKLRSNFVGTEFTLFDKGVNPKKNDKDPPSISRATVRQELGYLIYESNLLGNRGPRKMTCCIPEVDDDGKSFASFYEPGNAESSSSLQIVKNGGNENMVVLQNKEPQLDPKTNAFTLDFGGRVTMASIKNFQLCEDPKEPKSPVILQFGRCQKEEFSMDVTFPLSPLQAFGFCLASFDNKLALD